jgi:hypothetical protein
VARVRRSIGQAGRRQQPRQLVAHAARGRERGEVRGPLHPGLAGDRAADRDQHQADAEEDGGGAQDRRERLTWLAQQDPCDAPHPL